MLASLTQEQKAKAIISDQRIDLVLGPGQDGKTLQPEGLPGADMTDAQKARFMALIEARLGILNADDLAATMVAVKENIGQTTFAWWGPTEPLGAAYVRIVGPTVLIEFSPQANEGDPTDHAHNMYRDPTNEYGAAWTLDEVSVPPYQDLRRESGTLKIYAVADRRDGAGAHTLSYQNNYQPAKSQWTANVFLQPGAGWQYQVTGPQRSNDGQQLAVSYTVTEP